MLVTTLNIMFQYKIFDVSLIRRGRRRWSDKVWCIGRCRKSQHLRHRINIRRKTLRLRILIMLLANAN